MDGVSEVNLVGGLTDKKSGVSVFLSVCVCIPR